MPKHKVFARCTGRTNKYRRWRSQVAAIAISLFSTLLGFTTSVSAQLPPGWSAQDIGQPALAGSTTVAGGTYTVRGAGNDIWGTSDQFHFVNTSIGSTSIITARVTSFTNTDPWAKVGVMVRDTLAPDARHAMLVLTPSNGANFQWRARTGQESSSASGGAAAPPRWIRLTRYGNLILASISTDGQGWVEVARHELRLGLTAYAGLVVTSHNPGQLCTATFDNVSVVSDPNRITFGSGLLGEYFNNMTLSGEPVRTRHDRVIDFDWGSDAPLTGINENQFSVRWTGEIRVPATGSYVFTTTTDDGVRLWVNNQQIINQWVNQPPTDVSSGPITLVGGQRYPIRMEYYENTGGAVARLSWAFNGGPQQIIQREFLFSDNPLVGRGLGSGLRGEYFDNPTLASPIRATRTDPVVDFNWTGSPVAGVGAQFTARWTGQIEAPQTGYYSFVLQSDEGVRLWLNEQLVIDDWGALPGNASPTRVSDSFHLVGGQFYDIRLEYANRAGNGFLALRWLSPGISRRLGEIIPSSALYPSPFPSLPPVPPDIPVTAQSIDAARFLMQATYGPSPQDIADVLERGQVAWLNEQFALPPQATLPRLRAMRDSGEQVQMREAVEQFWLQSAFGRDQLRQRAAFALSQILVVSGRSAVLNGEAYAIASYMETLNEHAFSNYRTILREVTLHPAMGRYLDMLGSQKENPAQNRQANENYAREILQLFSIGLYELNLDGTLKLDPQGQPIPTYSQEQVVGFARAFTGWSWGGNPVKTEGNFFNPPRRNTWDLPMEAWEMHHSTAAKTLLNGVTLPPGQTALQDLEATLNNIFNHPNVGPFIGKQLIQRLVTSNPSPAYVARVAAVFNDNGASVRGDMRAVWRAILLDPEARSLTAANQPTYGKLREPVIRWVHQIRALYGWSESGRYLFGLLASPDNQVGQPPYHAPSVFNFYEPTYRPAGTLANLDLLAPEFKLANETSIVGLANFQRNTFQNGLGSGEHRLRFHPSGYLQMANGNVGKLIDALNLTLMSGKMTPQMRQQLVTAYPSLGSNDTVRLRTTVQLILTSKEFAVQR